MHNCGVALAAPPDTPALRPCCVSRFFSCGRSTVGRLRAEGLPAFALTCGPNGRAAWRFTRSDLEEWIAERTYSSTAEEAQAEGRSS